LTRQQHPFDCHVFLLYTTAIDLITVKAHTIILLSRLVKNIKLTQLA
jgi:hypothetical protein